MVRLPITVVLIAVLASGLVIGSTAFTTATLDRDASIDVVADGNGIIGLEDGTSGGLVTVTNDVLTIDFDPSASGYGVNVDATYELGDDGSPTTDMAFNVTNQDTVDHTVQLSYAFDSSDPDDGVANVVYTVYSSSGTLVATVDEDTTDSFTASSGVTYHVVVTVDTTGLSASNDLSGTMTVTAT